MGGVNLGKGKDKIKNHGDDDKDSDNMGDDDYRNVNRLNNE